MPPETFSRSEARRIALAAQGFDRPRPKGPLTVRHLRGVIGQLGLLQLDFVNVLIPAHYQIPFSRLGPYRPALLEELVYRRREFTEQWAHEASIVPMATWPLLRHRMANHRVRPYGFENFLKQNAPYADAVLEAVRWRGPLTADDVPVPDGNSRRIPGAWVSVPRAVLEAHFGRGLLAVAERRSNFARVYDLAERVVPPEHHGRQVGPEEAQRELLRQAARAHGIGTAADLADYFRMAMRDARPRLGELVEVGELREVRVAGWREPAYLDPLAKVPSRIEAAAPLSPFDPVVWFRPRTARLFGFDFRFEIFVPAEKRKWGAYVLPFLLGDRLVARVDLKADRSTGRLLVPAAYLEPDGKAGAVATALAAELRTLANWLGLESIAVGERGTFARPLAAAVREISPPGAARGNKRRA
jgi:uncharacterized protein YcaQ